MAVDGPLVVRELIVDDVHEGGEDSVQVVFNSVVKTKPEVEEWRSNDVDVYVGIEYESAINFGIGHTSLKWRWDDVVFFFSWLQTSEGGARRGMAKVEKGKRERVGRGRLGEEEVGLVQERNIV
ncbi:hypothetical protein MA16_Dca021403 [Dendrobium catenatum]|uniref:Uncharacterized protein n=1 Tax=Dendrobium catenatum TaxID=906689 RepID=A0A2I0WIY4_9ASPA|nr:hypothetical protein MA16_Dca021403 [Dendrobium catenatum]